MLQKYLVLDLLVVMELLTTYQVQDLYSKTHKVERVFGQRLDYLLGVEIALDLLVYLAGCLVVVFGTKVQMEEVRG